MKLNRLADILNDPRCGDMSRYHDIADRIRSLQEEQSRTRTETSFIDDLDGRTVTIRGNGEELKVPCAGTPVHEFRGVSDESSSLEFKEDEEIRRRLRDLKVSSIEREIERERLIDNKLKSL